MLLLRYEKRDTDFVLMENVGHGWRERSDRWPSVALFFDAEDGVLFKHGPPELVAAYAKNARKQYAERGLQVMTFAWTMWESAEWDVEELNKCLTITGYVKRLYEREFPSDSAVGRKLRIMEGGGT